MRLIGRFASDRHNKQQGRKGSDMASM